MDELPGTYERPWDRAPPVDCMDEQPVQFVKETREPLSLTTEYAPRVDFERAGTKAVFMFCEVLEGSRNATAHERRTRFK